MAKKKKSAPVTRAAKAKTAVKKRGGRKTLDYEKLLNNDQFKDFAPPEEQMQKLRTRVAQCVIKHHPLLNLISKNNANDKQRSLLIDSMDREQLETVRGLVQDFLSYRYPFSQEVVKNVKKEKDAVFRLANQKTPEGEMKTILKQKGGILGSLLIPLISTLGSYLIDKFLFKK